MSVILALKTLRHEDHMFKTTPVNIASSRPVCHTARTCLSVSREKLRAEEVEVQLSTGHWHSTQVGFGFDL